MIVVFGSLNMDLVMRVPNLPRPGETVLCPGYLPKPGGKGANQAVAARRAGATVGFYGAVGDDDFGTSLIGVLQAEGIAHDGVERAGRPTGCAVIGVDDQGENAIIVASGANLAARAAAVPDAVLGPATTLLMQMEVPADETWTLVIQAKARGTRTILNLAPAAPVPDRVLQDLDILIVNELEAATLAADLGIQDLPAVPRPLVDRVHGLACRLAARARCTVIVTLGAAGVVAAQADGSAWHVGCLPITPVDTTGAGDAFCGVFAAAIDAGLALDQALSHAAVGAGLACLALGAQEALPGEAAIVARLPDLPPPRRLS